MRPGLKIITLPGAYYGYAVTRVGWLRRVSGDEFELVGACTIARTGQQRLEGINKLASDGPGKGYQVSAADEGPEEVHRLLVRRCVPANEKAWREHCPKPKGWVEE